jgi:flagellar protein FlgJ
MGGSNALVLDGLKEVAARDPKGAARRAAVQFEALFMNMVLKSMRDSVQKTGMLDGPGSDLYQGMLDAQFAQTLSGQAGGLSELIARQLLRGDESVPGGANAEMAAALRLGATKAPHSARGAAPQGVAADPVVGSIEGLPAAIAQRAAAAFAQAAAQTANQQGPMEPRLAPMPMLGFEGPALQGAGKNAPMAFVTRTWSAAQAVERATGVPAAFVVGQAALETGWGRFELKLPNGQSAHNLFGIKAGAGWQGAVVEAPTTEYVQGRAVRRVERFRAYPNDAEAFADWSRLMRNSPRYREVLQHGGDVQTFARGIQRAGYATDPAYASKLERTIRQALSLRRLDT